jgi:ribose 5-phosphate isomerase A
MDLKRKAAEEAVRLIEENTIIGLGAGSTVAYVIDLLDKRIKDGLKVEVVTSSFSTKLHCLNKNITVKDHSTIGAIHLYLDGCDQFDRDLNALKSGGAVHTQEKLLASMANEFIILGDQSKYVQQLEPKYPVVVDVIPNALFFVLKRIKDFFPESKPHIRKAEKKDGAVITENGNIVVDIFFRDYSKLKTINPTLKSIPGIIETSLFIGLASKAILGTPEGIRIIT